MAYGEVIEKTLSRNDVGATGAHQAGLYVGTPNTVPSFFPDLDENLPNPGTELRFNDDDGQVHTFRLYYWNQGTRKEYHLTNMTEFFNRQGARPGDHVVLRRDAAGALHATVVPAGADLPGDVLRKEGAWNVRSATSGVAPGRVAERTSPFGNNGADTETDPGEGYRKGLPEGARTRIKVNRYERSEANRDKCLAVHGYDCQVCGMNFQEEYGEIGRRFIEVHHLTPLSDLNDDYEIDPTTDLVPVCANCHRMMHRRNPPYTLEEMASICAGT